MLNTGITMNQTASLLTLVQLWKYVVIEEYG